LVATLKKDPPDLSVATQDVSPDLKRLVRHCLEKDPDRRFQSARNLTSELAALSDVSAASQKPWGRFAMAIRRIVRRSR
jgi:serine/threonine protein kinase